jgi:carbon-monoxide dehydrogenase medium subunit
MLVKPAPFEYLAPTSLEQALRVLGERGDEAKVLAGGQSLLPLLNMRLARPSLLVDLNRVAELAYVEAVDGALRIGAMTRQRTAERSEAVATHAPLLRDAVRWIGHPAIRTRGTIGGSLAHADAVAELPCALVALEGTLVAHRRTVARSIAAADFFQSVFTTALAPDELLVEVRVPVQPPRTGWAFIELARRHGDFAIVGVGALLTLDARGQIAGARLAYAGAADRPVRAERAEAALIGQPPTEATFAAAAQQAAEMLDPPSDLHGSADYRRTIAISLTRRALATAAARATA